MIDHKPTTPTTTPPIAPETIADAREFADILRPFGCACGTRIEARCGRSAARLFAGVDIDGRTFADMAVSLGLPPQEARALLDLARAEVIALLCLALVQPSGAPSVGPSAPGGCACPES